MQKLCRIVLFSLCLLLLVIAAGVTFLRSNAGARWVAEVVNNRVAGITIRGMEGTLPEEIRIQQLTLSDSAGPWLEVKDLYVEWHPLALAKNQWNITVAQSSDIQLIRLPLSEAEAEAKPFSFPSIPDIVIGKLVFPSIVIEPAVTGQLLTLDAKGSGDAGTFTLLVTTLTGPATSLRLDTDWKGPLQAQLAFDEAPGGVAGTLLALPKTDALHIAFRAKEANESIAIDQMQIDISTAHITGAGQYTPVDGALSGDFTLTISDLSAFSQLAEMPLAGRMDGTVALAGTHALPQAKILLHSNALSIDENDLTGLMLETNLKPDRKNLGFNATGEALLNGTTISTVLNGNIAGQTLALTGFQANYGDYHLTGKGEAHFDDRQFETTLSLAPTQINDGMTLSADAKANGHFDAFHTEVHAMLETPQGKAEITAKGNFDAETAELRGDINGVMTGGMERFTLSSPLLASQDEIAFDKIALEGVGTSLQGKASWLLQRQQAEAALTLAATDLAPLGALLNLPMSGQLSADIVLIPGTKTQEARIHATATALEMGVARFDTLTLKATGDESRIGASADGNGSINALPFTLSMQATGERDARSTHIRLQKFSGLYDTSPFSLVSSPELRILPEKNELTPMELTLAGGSATLKGTMSDRAIDAEIMLKHIALNQLPILDIPAGTLNGSLRLTGAPSMPKAVLRADSELRSGDFPVTASLDAVWHNATLTLNGEAKAEAATAEAHISLPGRFSIVPFSIGVNGQSPLQGNVLVHAPLDSLNSYTRQYGTHISGQISGNAELAGQLSTPTFKGKFTLANGVLDHQDSGICLQNVEATLLANGQEVVLQKISAHNSEGTLSGQASLSLQDGNPLKGTVKFSDFELFCGGVAKGILNGDLQASGTKQAAKLTGALTLGPLNIQLPGQTPGNIHIPQVDTVQVEPDKKKTTHAQNANAPMMLDITLNAPERIFVRGRGLDAEFYGNLVLTGPVNNIDVAGQFKARRGRFTLLDRELKLTTAILRFNGNIPPSPYLDITAGTMAGTTSIETHLTGPAAKPVFSFNSTPSLPQDEILALLLFGRQLSSLTPFQAIQLAQSVAELSGESSGPDVLGHLRGALGVERLDVSSGENNSVTVGAGKYITDKVYIGVTQGAEPQDRSVTTEVEVTPRISATTSVNAEGQQSLGVQWKYDY